MESGCSPRFNALAPLRRARVQSHLLGSVSGRGIFGRCVLPFCRDPGVAIQWSSGTELEPNAYHRLVVRLLLCCDHLSELALPFSDPSHFLSRDYTLPGCGCMAFAEGCLSLGEHRRCRLLRGALSKVGFPSQTVVYDHRVPRWTKIGLCVLLTGGALFSKRCAWAHHSFASTYSNETITIQGTVVEFLFRNPHSAVLLKASDPKGKT